MNGEQYGSITENYAELLKRALLRVQTLYYGRRHECLWSIAVDLCAIGSTRAHKLCEDLGLDPDAKVMVKQVDPRDDEHPCPEYVPGEPAGTMCMGDGHYLCQECSNYVPEQSENLQ